MKIRGWVPRSLRLFRKGRVHAPGLPISRVAASTLTLLPVVSAALSFTFKSRELNWVDQIALLATVFAVAWGLLDNAPALLAFGVIVLALFFAWICDRLNFHIPPLPWAKHHQRHE